MRLKSNSLQTSLWQVGVGNLLLVVGLVLGKVDTTTLQRFSRMLSIPLLPLMVTGLCLGAITLLGFGLDWNGQTSLKRGIKGNLWRIETLEAVGRRLDSWPVRAVALTAIVGCIGYFLFHSNFLGHGHIGHSFPYWVVLYPAMTVIRLQVIFANSRIPTRGSVLGLDGGQPTKS